MRKLSPRVETALIIGFCLLIMTAVAQWTIAAGQQVVGARGKAGAIACVTDLKSLGIALSQYTQDNDETFPPNMTTPQAFQAALLPFTHDTSAFVCPDTGLAYIPNAALSGQNFANIGNDYDAIEVARDAAPHEDGETAVVSLDGSVQRGGVEYDGDPNNVVRSRAKQLALGVEQYVQDYDEILPPMQTPEKFQTAVSPYLKSRKPFSTPNGSLFIPNAALDGVDINSLPDPAHTVLFQDTPPYVGGQPTIAYADGHVTHATPAMPLLWANADGTAAVWNLHDAQPQNTCALYGPYAGWTPKTIAQGPNGNTRLLWTNADGRAALWNLADVHPNATCAVYGPYSGWTATALTVGPDNAAHLLWDNANGEIALWNTANADPAATCLLAGPYPGWTGKAIGIGPDNHERVLWDNQDGRVSVWNLADTDPTATCKIYGPYSGWTGQSLTVGADNAAYLLWDNVSGQVSVWDLNDLHPSADCLLFGPYDGWTGTGLTIEQDTSLRLHWNNAAGQTAIWNLDDLQPDTTCQLHGPFSGWSAQPSLH